MRYGFVPVGLVSAALFGIAMIPFAAVGSRSSARPRLDARNAARLGVAVAAGGGLGPVLLLLGLSVARACSAALWPNLELAATAALGALLFHDHLDAAGWFGVGGAVAAGVLVTLVKGLVAGSVNTVIGSLIAAELPEAKTVLAALGLGAVCCGGSIALFIGAAQRIAAARAPVLFTAGPSFGVLLSLVLLAERLAWQQGVAAVVLAGAIALMLRARQSHAHRHETMYHVHIHRHDDLHHDHPHDGAAASVSHTHAHAHEPIEHDHVHLPDLHHRHEHRKEGR